MDQIFGFLFGTRTGVAVLFAIGVVAFAVAAFILEKRTHKLYVDRGPKPNDEDSLLQVATRHALHRGPASYKAPRQSAPSYWLQPSPRSRRWRG